MIRLPHLETNVTAACQNRCISCNHFVPLQLANFKRSMIDPRQMARDLAIFSQFVHVDAYGMLGGEPTLHPEIERLLYIAKASEVADRVELWTNGQTLRQMPESFWAAPDVIVVSAYPGKLTDDDLDWIRNRSAQARIGLEIKDERRYPNFTQLLEPKDTDPQATQRKYEQCWFKTFSRVLDNGYFYRCCTSPYIPKLLQNRPEGSDGLRVDQLLTEEKIARFLNQSTAMQSCTICAGRNTPSARPVPWREVKEPAAWLAASSGRH